MDPAVTKREWTDEEEVLLFQLQETHGNCWALIAKHFPGRTDNAIKNHYYSTMRKTLRRCKDTGELEAPALTEPAFSPETGNAGSSAETECEEASLLLNLSAKPLESRAEPEFYIPSACYSFFPASKARMSPN